jgi:hypothetical protein
MATNARAMQYAETVVDGQKGRRLPGDVNRRQMSMGSWHADLSKGGAPRPGTVKGRTVSAPTKGSKT